MKAQALYDEKELLLRLQNGDHAAFEKIYNAYYYNLTGHLLRLLKSKELASEVLQDTFFALWQHRDRIDTEQPIKAYLFRIATNNAYNIFKRASHDEKLKAYLYPIIEAGYEHIEANILRRENQELLHGILQKMPAKQREVYILCKLEDKSYQEVSALLNISVNTINTHIKRANLFFKTYISDHPDTFALLLLSLSIGYK